MSFHSLDIGEVAPEDDRRESSDAAALRIELRLPCPAERMLRREKAGTFCLQSAQTQMGSGVPQTLSLEMHHGGNAIEEREQYRGSKPFEA